MEKEKIIKKSVSEVQKPQVASDKTFTGEFHLKVDKPQTKQNSQSTEDSHNKKPNYRSRRNPDYQTAGGDGRRQRSKFKQNRIKKNVNKVFEEKVINISRVTKVTKGGRQFKFAALVVIGDLKGRVGFGIGKAREVPEAIKKAIRDAEKKIITTVNVNGTVPYEIIGKFGAARVLIKPAPNGKGIIAGGPTRAIFELAGYSNVYTKSFRSRNKINVIQATFNALTHMHNADYFKKLHEVDEKEVKNFHNNRPGKREWTRGSSSYVKNIAPEKEMSPRGNYVGDKNDHQ